MSLSPAILWLIAGVVLCVLEFVFPTAFVEFTMGLSAIVVALALIALPYLPFGVQVILWLLLSVGLTILSRRLVPKRSHASALQDAVEAQTLTEIPAGQVGRVLYEGNSWAARCGDEELAISPNQPVYVVDRKGTTLIVMPQHLIH